MQRKNGGGGLGGGEFIFAFGEDDNVDLYFGYKSIIALKIYFEYRYFWRTFYRYDMYEYKGYNVVFRINFVV